MPEQTYTRKEVMAMYQVGYNTLHKWLSSGRMPHIKIGKMVRFTQANLAQFEKNHLRKGVTV